MLQTTPPLGPVGLFSIVGAGIVGVRMHKVNERAGLLTPTYSPTFPPRLPYLPTDSKNEF